MVHPIHSADNFVLREMPMPSIKDVAKLAGVSPSTVSLVLNGSSLVKHETAYRVNQAIDQLHYVPNQAARSLVTKKNRVISLVRITDSRPATSDADTFEVSVDTLIMDMLPGLQRVLYENRYSLLTDVFVPLDKPAEDITIVDPNLVDGVIFVGGMTPPEAIEKVCSLGIPAVFAYKKYDKADYIDTDASQGIYLAAKHLLENGHRDIAFINGSTHSSTNVEKIAGFRRALEESHCPFREEWVRSADFIARAGYQAFRSIWESGLRPTAVIGSCDNVAMGIYRFLNEQGLRCPEDVSVIGYEASILSSHCVPPLTSVSVNKMGIGAEAGRMLINRIRNPKAKPMHMIIPPELICRESVLKIN